MGRSCPAVNAGRPTHRIADGDVCGTSLNSTRRHGVYSSSRGQRRGLSRRRKEKERRGNRRNEENNRGDGGSVIVGGPLRGATRAPLVGMCECRHGRRTHTRRCVLSMRARRHTGEADRRGACKYTQQRTRGRTCTAANTRVRECDSARLIRALRVLFSKPCRNKEWKRTGRQKKGAPAAVVKAHNRYPTADR